MHLVRKWTYSPHAGVAAQQAGFHQKLSALQVGACMQVLTPGRVQLTRYMPSGQGLGFQTKAGEDMFGCMNYCALAYISNRVKAMPVLQATSNICYVGSYLDFELVECTAASTRATIQRLFGDVKVCALRGFH